MNEKEGNTPNSASDACPSGSDTPNVQKEKTKNLIFIAVIVVLALVIFVLVRSEGNSPNNIPGTNPGGGRAVLVTEDNVDEIQEELMEPVEDGYYQATMSIDWHFDNGNAVSSDAFVKNTETNTRMVYFDIILEDGTLAYSSPFIPVGATLDTISLDKDLDVGDYPAVCTYHLVDDEKEELSTVSVAITLHILN